MPVFVYKACDSTGKIITGTMEVKDRTAVTAGLQASNYYPLQIDEQQKDQGISATAGLTLSFQRVKKRDILTFTNQLGILMEAGLPLDRSLAILKDLTDNKKFARIIDNILRSIEGGSSLADALARHPRVFSRLYVNMIKAGETGGVLELVIKRLSEFLGNSQALQDDIISAMIYPTLLTLVAASAVATLLLFVVPKFAAMFSDMGQALPLSTQILLGVTDILINYWWAILGSLVLLIIASRYFIGTESGKYTWDGWKLKIPLLGALIQQIEAARFTRTLGTLIKSGVPILQGLNIVKDIISNSVISAAMYKVSNGLKEGGGITTPLMESHVFPPLVTHMTAIGEETGQLDTMLIKVADSYDEEIRNSIKRLISFIEPAMILLMGIVVGFIVVAMLMAIFSVNQMPF
ncbi:MAG: type II secretion system F family protein [Candidatus Schekmanbacteria bacterium]|nr:type II secretion system F family protein [Candidatus Schekmanbacteria bacterium]